MALDRSSVPEQSPRYFGWRVVAATFLMAVFGWGLGFYGHSVYLAELTRLHGWSASIVAGMTTVYYLVSAALVVFVSDAVRRFGPRPVVLVGVAALAISAAGIGFAASPRYLLGAYLVMSVGWASLTLAAITNILGLWFQEKRGLALSLALNGASTGGIIGVPLLIWLIGRYGFRAAMQIAAVAVILLLLPMVLVWIDRPRPAHPSVTPLGACIGDGEGTLDRLQAMQSPHFWTIAAPFAVGLLAQVGFIVHQIAFLEPSLGRQRAGFAVAITTVMAVVGRVGLGFFIDRLDQRQVTAASLLAQAISLLLMMGTSSPAALYAGSALFGLSVGNLITLPALIIQREYPASAFGMLTALVVAINQVAYSVGPGLLGVLRDATGGYAAPLALCMALEIAGAIIVLLKLRR